MLTITETLHHGTYVHTASHEVETIDATTVHAVMAASPYGYNPGPPLLARYVHDLAAGREASHGWSRFTVMASATPVVPGTAHTETMIRRAMIATGYGDGFSLNLPAERLADYADDPRVATWLAAHAHAAAVVPATVHVGVIEWGSAHDDQSPAIFTAHTADAVQLAAYRDMVDAASWADPDVDVETLPAVDESDPTTVSAWLDAWREQTTAAWLTITESEVLS